MSRICEGLPPPYPLEFILRDAVGPDGMFHGNVGNTISAIVDYPFITARYGIPLKAVICRNGRYGLLDENIKVYWKENNIVPHDYPECFSLAPQVDFVKLARSMGVEGIKADTREEARAAARALFEESSPFLVELNTEQS